MLELDIISTKPVREAATALRGKLSTAYRGDSLRLPYSGPVDSSPGNWLWQPKAEEGDQDLRTALEAEDARFEGLEEAWQRLVGAVRDELGVDHDTGGISYDRGSLLPPS